MNRIDAFKKAIKIAEEATEDIKDTQLKIAAFKVILNSMVDNSDILQKTRNERETVASIKTAPGPSIKTVESGGDEGLVYHLRPDNTFEITADIGKDTGKMKQIQYVLLYLYLKKLHQNDGTVTTSTMQKIMHNAGFPSLPNINNYLRDVKNLIIVKTGKKRADNTYEMTGRGVKVTKTLIGEIMQNKGIMPEEPIAITGEISRKRNVVSPLAKDVSRLIREGFFNVPRSVKEVKEKMEEKGRYYPRNIIDEKIRRRFLGKELRRIKEGKCWRYTMRNK